MVNKLIKVNNLTTDLGMFKLENISLAVEPNNIVGIVGENGAGKTSLLKSIAGIYKVQSGQVDMDFSKLGFAFDDLPFPSKLTVSEISKVFDNIINGWDNAAFNLYVKSFGLPTSVEVQDFSKGMKAQLNLAVTLSHHATILLFDEITSGLDPIVRNTVLKAIKDYASSKGAAVMITTHNLDDVSKICSKLLLIDNGKITLRRKVLPTDNAKTIEKDFVKAIFDRRG